MLHMSTAEEANAACNSQVSPLEPLEPRKGLNPRGKKNVVSLNIISWIDSSLIPAVPRVSPYLVLLDAISVSPPLLHSVIDSL